MLIITIFIVYLNFMEFYMLNPVGITKLNRNCLIISGCDYFLMYFWRLFGEIWF